PRSCEVAVAVDARVRHIGSDPELLLEPVEIVVCHELRFLIRHASVSCCVEITVMEVHVIKTEIISQRMHMHLSDALSVISSFCQFSCHRMFIIPRNVVLVSHTTVVALLHSGVQGGSGGDTAGTCAVCMVKYDSLSGECIQIRRFDIRVSGIAKTVPAKLIGHDQYDIRLFHSVPTPCLFCLYTSTIIQVRRKSKESCRKITAVPIWPRSVCAPAALTLSGSAQ